MVKKVQKLLAASAIALAAISAAGCGVGEIGGTPATSTSQTPATTVQQPPVDNHGVGIDGGLRFTVRDIRSATEIGYAKPSHGEYLVILEKVQNISDKTASVGRLNSDVLIDNTGRQYSSDYGAASAIPSEYSSTGTLQPGSWAPFAEAYDVPVGTTPTAVVMHGDLFTPGVRISVNDFTPTPIDLSP